MDNSQIDDDNKRNCDYYDRFDLFDYYKAYHSYRYNVYDYLQHYHELKDIQLQCQNARRIVIVGMGFGRELEIVLKSVRSPTITIIDLSENFISQARRIYNTDNLTFIKQNLNVDSKLILPDESVDLILAMNTLEYVLDDINFYKLINEFNRILVKNGIFYFRLLNLNYPLSYKLLQDLNSRGKHQSVYRLRDYTTVRFYLEKLFTITSIRSDDFGFPFGRLYFIYSGYTAYIFYKIGILISKILPYKFSRSVYFTNQK